MLPKQHRLSRADFDLVYKQGRRVRGESFGLVVLADDSSEVSKIGIVVSSKVLKNAADRNKLKRQIRSILVENILPNLTSRQKIILTAFPAPKTRKFEETRDELVSLFDSLKS